MKELSCGVVIKFENSLLVCHATGKKYWDIPKGRQDQGEDYLATAYRELQEEVGIDVDPMDLKYLGHFDYIPKKDLELFLWDQKEKSDTSKMKCSSFFEINGNMIPECDAYAYVDFDSLHKFLTKNMHRVLTQVIKEHI